MCGHSRRRSGWAAGRQFRVAMANGPPAARCTPLKCRTSETCVVAAHSASFFARSQRGCPGVTEPSALSICTASSRRAAVLTRKSTRTPSECRPGMMLVTRQTAQVPVKTAFRRALEIARVRSRHRDVSEVDLALVLRRQHRRRKAAAVTGGVGVVQGLDRIRVDRRQAGFHRREPAVERDLRVVEGVLERRGLVGRDVVGHPDVRHGDAGELAGETDGLERAAVVLGHGDGAPACSRGTSRSRAGSRRACAPTTSAEAYFAARKAGSDSAPGRGFQSSE